MHDHQAVIPREKDTDLYLTLLLGPAGRQHSSAFHADILGGLVKFVRLGNLHNNTLCANILIQVNSDVKEFDSRPCDAVFLAVRAQVPIYAEESC